MTTGELLVGMEIFMGCSRSFDFTRKARVEAIGIDWAVLRDEHSRPWFTTAAEIQHLEPWSKEKDEAGEY